jgi:hypothetical protein
MLIVVVIIILSISNNNNNNNSPLKNTGNTGNTGNTENIIKNYFLSVNTPFLNDKTTTIYSSNNLYHIDFNIFGGISILDNDNNIKWYSNASLDSPTMLKMVLNPNGMVYIIDNISGVTEISFGTSLPNNNNYKLIVTNDKNLALVDENNNIKWSNPTFSI